MRDLWHGGVSLDSCPQRFHQLRARIDEVGDKMLTQTCGPSPPTDRSNAPSFPTSPPSVVYELTDLGIQAAQELEPFLRWIRTVTTSGS